ncbi:hypothetical protein Tco_0908190 [Tanacetum coccineum]|uniref:Uncharacterized protein n=1 Tax=Tanacetum coccineum TaxID=301880 RepID=A0ABQ5CLF0_9ASTR
MSSTTAQQTKLNLELVPKENRLDIGKCNGRIPRRLTPREPTFQVVLDAIALTPCYPAFLITADVPEVYMHQFWNSVYKHDTFYRFKLDKKKRFKLTLEVSEISFRFAEEYMVETLIPFLLKKTLYLKIEVKNIREIYHYEKNGYPALSQHQQAQVFKITFSHSSQDKATSSHLMSMISTSNHKLMIEVKDYELKTEVKAFDTSTGNPIKEILLKLNLPDHRSILTDSKEYIKMVMEVPDSS